MLLEKWKMLYKFSRRKFNFTDMFVSLNSVFEKVSNKKNMKQTLDKTYLCFKFENFLKEQGFDCKVGKVHLNSVYIQEENPCIKQALIFKKDQILAEFNQSQNLQKINKIAFLS